MESLQNRPLFYILSFFKILSELHHSISLNSISCWFTKHIRHRNTFIVDMNPFETVLYSSSASPNGSFSRCIGGTAL